MSVVHGTSLFTFLTTFVGREKAIADVEAQISAHRLVTLTGVGGSGKTRLAVEVAARVADRFADGVVFVDLSALPRDGDVGGSVEVALGLSEEQRRSVRDVVASHLAPKHQLLVLDNCEHVALACAELVETLLRGCPGVRVLATSRELLTVPGERVWRVPPLDVDTEAPRLFADRASALDADFVLDAETLPYVREICARLDGLPLAIELAAARVPALGVSQIAERLDRRLAVLTSGGRVPRQRTLRAAIDWSVDLLDERERRVLEALSVFAGGCSLDAAEAVCADEQVPRDEVLDALTALVERSLVVPEPHGPERRYRLLETLREYAAEKLQARDAALVHRRHTDWLLGRRTSFGPYESAKWLAFAIREEDNYRAAIAWELSSGHARVALWLALVFADVWVMTGRPGEGRKTLQSALAAATDASAQERIYALANLAVMAPTVEQRMNENLETVRIAREHGDPTMVATYIGSVADTATTLGDAAFAQHVYQRLLLLARAGGEHDFVGWCLRGVARHAFYAADYAAALAAIDEAIPVERRSRDEYRLAAELANLANVHFAQGRTAEALALSSEAVAMARGMGATANVQVFLIYVGDAFFALGDLASARESYDEALELARRGSFLEAANLAHALRGLGCLERAEGRRLQASQLLSEAVDLVRTGTAPLVLAAPCLHTLAYERMEAGDTAGARDLVHEALAVAGWPSLRGVAADIVDAAAAVRLAEGDADDAARLLGLGETLRSAIGAVIRPWDAADRERAAASVQSTLGDDAFHAAYDAGRRDSLDDAVRRLGVAPRELYPMPRWILDEAAAPDAPTALDEATLAREGDYWTAAFAGRTTRLRDAKGLGYLTRLLAVPHVEIGALALAGAPETAEVGDELLDTDARRAYKARLDALGDELDEARQWSDPVRADGIQDEIDALVRELTVAAGLGGRTRRTPTASERARVAVTKAIKSAIERIAKECPELGAHLRDTVRTGTVCVYRPDPRVPLRWHL